MSCRAFLYAIQFIFLQKKIKQQCQNICPYCFFVVFQPGYGRGRIIVFVVYLKDKGDDGFRVEEPEAYLSRQAIERRAKNDIAVTDADFPISRSYIAMLSETGATPVVQSKWFATVVVESPDSTVAEQLQQLAIVDSVKWIWKGNLRVRPRKSGRSFCVGG